MSLTSSMWTSVTGLLAHGEKMNVVGNNISNVNTVAYKSQRMDFQDFVYQHIGTASGMGQVGRGTAIGAIMSDFSQGSMESTTRSTDIAIEGNGFFCVKPKNHEASYYTRAGNFSFNKNGELVDPNGYVLQGWAIDQGVADNINRSNGGIIGSGSPVDVRLSTFTCPPRHTSKISTPVNLKSSTAAGTDDNCTDETDPFFAMLKTWDASQKSPLGSGQYAHQTTINVYDEAGKMHKLSIHFDRVSNGKNGQTVAGNADGESYWEYVVSMDPSEDVRDFNSSYDPSGSSPTNPNVPESLKGLLAAGTISFNSSGQMTDMTCFVPQSDPSNPNDKWWSGEAGKEKVNLDKWVAAPINSDGLPVIAPNFSGTGGMQNAYKEGNWIGPNAEAEGRLVALDIGLKINNGEWAFITGPAIPANAYVTLTDGPLSADGKPMGPGGTKTLDLGGPLYDPSSWTGTGTQRIVGGVPLTLYLVQDTRDGMPSSYYTTQAPTTPDVTIQQQWPVMDPPKAAFDSKATEVGTGKPLGSNGKPLNVGETPLYSEADLGSGGVRRKDPDNPSDDLALYLVTNVTNPDKKFYIKPDELVKYSGDPDYIVDSTPTYICDPVKQTLPNTDMLDSKGNPLTANAPQEVNLGGPLYDVSKLPTTPLPPTRRKDANGQEMTLYLIENTTDSTKPPFYYSLEAPANNASIKQAIPLWEPDPRVIHNGETERPVSAGDIGTSKYHINGMDGLSEPTESQVTCLGDSFYDKNGFGQDGYPHGDLRDVSVDTNGVLSATYSNGQTLELYQIVLYDFRSTQNLRREGGNLYSETRDSGVPSSGAAGTGSFGTTRGYYLEQSNADISREFVNMITTQRGFQANSKTITTVDTMLETVIGMKR